MYNRTDYKIGGVMVLFKPNWDITNKAVISLSAQVDQLCIIDNTPDIDNSSSFKDIENIHYIPLKENRGIAAAQNIGIDYLKEQMFNFIVFSDQDSIAPHELVYNLFSEFFILKNSNCNIGILGPTPINRATGKPYENKKKYIRNLRIGNNDYIESQSIISSFSFIPILLFDKIGYYKEDLFIDFVENEWCFRLTHLTGLSAYISRQLLIQHELGESRFLLGRQINISTPFRLYFQIRNYLWLRRLNYVPKEWKKQVWNKIILKLIYYPIIPSKRVNYIKSIINGIKDGFKYKL